MASAGPIDLTSLEGVLAEAVQRGAPLFNQGDARGCVEAYRQAARDCLAMAIHNPDQVARLQAGLRESEACVSDNDAAWTLRRMIDDITAVERGERQTKGIKNMISEAIAFGVPQYNRGDHAGCYATYRTCVTSLIERLKGGSDGIPANVAVQIQTDLQTAHDEAEAAVESGMDVRAWKLRKAMDAATENLNSAAGLSQTKTSIYDFSKDAQSWNEVSDRVMGGISSGNLQIAGGVATFSGELRIENNGGFASVRSPDLGSTLPECKGIVITCQGDGNRYKLQCRTVGSSEGLVYQADFVAESGGFHAVRLPFSRFNPTFRGSVVPNAVALTGPTIKNLGLITSKLTDVGHKNPQFKPGGFLLKIQKIETF